MLKDRYYYSDATYDGSSKVVMSKDNDIISFVETPKKLNESPRVTICGLWDDEKNVMYFGVARCSHKDSFKRWIGRKIAKNRAIEKPSRTVTIKENERVPDVFINNAEELVDIVLYTKHPIKFENL